MIHLPLVVLTAVFLAAASPGAAAGDSPEAQNISRQIYLDGPGFGEAIPCDVVQVHNANGEIDAYFMDVDSVICVDEKCDVITVRIHFDPLGHYERYEFPSGGNLTKWGHKPFSPSDHEKLHRILSDPYSPLKSVEWDQITMPKGPGEADKEVDGVSRATVLSKRSVVVTGAAYTCCTLWHWSHGEAVKVIREMTVSAHDKQDWIRYLHSGEDAFVEFAMDQMQTQNLFDTESVTAVVHVLRHGKARLADPALAYLEKASAETGDDSFFRCCEDEILVADPDRRVQFLEALRETDQKLPPGYLDRFSGWLPRADSYYEVHLLLTLRERETASSDEVISEAMSLLGNDDSLVVRRSYRFLKTRKLNESQREKLEAFERQNPNP